MTEKRVQGNAAAAIAELIEPGMAVGLGTGRAATQFVEALGRRVKEGLSIRGIPTSRSTTELATRLGIPLVTFDTVTRLDIAVDGADEIDPRGFLVKGLGGALLRERVVASAADRFFVLASPEKLTDAVGTRGVLPLEVVPFAVSLVRHRLNELGIDSTLRRGPDGNPFISDNANNILDLAIKPLDDPRDFHSRLRAIPGVVDSGLFLDGRPTIYIQEGDQYRVIE